MAWAKNGTPSTLTGTADVITISDLTAKKFNMTLLHIISSGTTNNHAILNNDETIKYARRYTNDGEKPDEADANVTSWDSDVGTPTADLFKVGYFVSISGEEKLGISFEINPIATGAGTAPSRREWVCKYVPSPDADITRIDWINETSGDFAIGSNLSALGTD